MMTTAILRLPQPARRRLLALRRAPRAPAPSARGYLGGAGDMQSRRDADDAVARREQELWDRARPRYDAIMERHVRLPASEGPNGEDPALDVRRKRLIYRSKQRGWLEVDLLLGTWAAEHVPALAPAALDEYEAFVNLETIDIYNVLTLRTDVPEGMKGDGEGEGAKSLVQEIQDWVKASPLGRASVERYAEVKAHRNLI